MSFSKNRLDEYFESFFWKVVNKMDDKAAAQKIVANKDVIKTFWKEAMYRGFGFPK